MTKEKKYKFNNQKGIVKINSNIYVRKIPSNIGNKPIYEIKYNNECKNTLEYIGWVEDGMPIGVSKNSKWYKDTSGNYFWSGNVIDIFITNKKDKKIETAIKNKESEVKWYYPIRKDKFIIKQAFLNFDPESYTITGHHTGVDYSTKGENNVPLYFCSDGEVIESGKHRVYGNYFFFYVVGVDYTFAYFHLRDLAPSEGIYKAGSLSGIAGNTGSASRGIHLHLECLKGKKFSNDRIPLFTAIKPFKKAIKNAAEDPDKFIRSRLFN